MRREDPTGEFVESDAFPGLLVLREPGDAGPFFKVWPEGHIEGFDGRHVPESLPLEQGRWPALAELLDDALAEQIRDPSDPEALRAAVEERLRASVFSWIDDVSAPRRALGAAGLERLRARCAAQALPWFPFRLPERPHRVAHLAADGLLAANVDHSFALDDLPVFGPPRGGAPAPARGGEAPDAEPPVEASDLPV